MKLIHKTGKYSIMQSEANGDYYIYKGSKIVDVTSDREESYRIKAKAILKEREKKERQEKRESKEYEKHEHYSILGENFNPYKEAGFK